MMFKLLDQVRLVTDHAFNGIMIDQAGEGTIGQIRGVVIDNLSGDPRAYYTVIFAGVGIDGLTEDQLELVEHEDLFAPSAFRRRA